MTSEQIKNIFNITPDSVEVLNEKLNLLLLLLSEGVQKQEEVVSENSSLNLEEPPKSEIEIIFDEVVKKYRYEGSIDDFARELSDIDDYEIVRFSNFAIIDTHEGLEVLSVEQADYIQERRNRVDYMIELGDDLVL